MGDGAARKAGGRRGPWEALHTQFHGKGKETLCTQLGTAELPLSREKCVLGGLPGARGPQGCSERALMAGE